MHTPRVNPSGLRAPSEPRRVTICGARTACERPHRSGRSCGPCEQSSPALRPPGQPQGRGAASWLRCAGGFVAQAKPLHPRCVRAVIRRRHVPLGHEIDSKVS
eukprot:3381139-Prymnesium_polylepis.1